MKSILTIILSFLLVVSGLAQTRNVVVNTNGAVVQPTNFWSADITNARSGLGLGSAATNPASAFQPSSTVLSNLTSSNAVDLTNVRATNIVGASFSLTASALSDLSSNNAINLTNIQASNVVGTIALSNLPSISFSNAVQSFVSDVSSATNVVTNSRNITVYSISPTVNLITNTVQLPTSNAIAGDLARIIHTGPTNSVTRIRKIGEVTNLITLNQESESVNFIYNGTNWLVLPNNAQIFPIYFSGTNATLNAAISRTNLGLGLTSSVEFGALRIDGSDQMSIQGAAGNISFYDGIDSEIVLQIPADTDPVVINSQWNDVNVRSNLGLGATWLTNTNVTNFRTAIGLGTTNYVIFSEVSAQSFSAQTNIFEIYKPIWIGDSGTNDIFQFETGDADRAKARTNLGLGWSALTNSNAGTRLVSVDSNGSVVSPTNFWQSAPVASNLLTVVQTFSPTTNSTNAATNGRNVYVYSLSTNVSGVTNTITLPTNASTLAGDTVTLTHQGLTNSTTAIRRLGSTNNIITINSFDEAVKFIYENDTWAFYHNISFVEPIRFSGTNASVNAAASRTNLGLGTLSDVVFNSVSAMGEATLTSYGIDAAVWGGGQLDFEEMQFFGSSGFDWDFGGSGIYNFGTIAFANTTNAATTRTNLGLGATNNFDISQVTLQSSGSITSPAIRFPLTQGTNIVYNGFAWAGANSGRLSYTHENNTAFVVDNILFRSYVPFSFEGASATTNAAITRTNLGLPLAALTNTNNAGFQRNIFSTNAAPTNSANINTVNFNTAVAWMEVSVITNGVTNSYRIPLFQ